MTITFEQGLMIGIALLTWIYSIMCLIKTKNIEVKCDSGSNMAVIVLYVLAAISLVALNINAINITTGIMLIIGGIIYSLIPSGYDKDYVYLKGTKVKYSSIKEMNLSERDGNSQLSISIDGKKYRTFFAKYDDKNKLNECIARWRRAGK